MSDNQSGPFSVKLHLYDLLNFDGTNFARSFIQQAVPNLQGIWHTGIVVYGVEYYFGGGIQSGVPLQTPYGTPIQVIDLGTTEITQDIFEAYLEEMDEKYNANTYDLFTNNCNNFSNDASQFLTGEPIPSHITALPQEFLQSDLGRMLSPIIRSFTGQGNAPGGPAGAQGMENLANMFGSGAGGMPDMQTLANMMGGGAGGAGGMPDMQTLANMMGRGAGGAGGMPDMQTLANMMGGGAGGMPNLANMANMFNNPNNPFAGANPFAPPTSNGLFGNPGAATGVSTGTASAPERNANSGHLALQLTTLVVNSKQPTLFSSSASIEKVFGKLTQFAQEENISLSSDQVKILADLQDALANRKTTPHYKIPLGCFKFIAYLYDKLSLEHKFPLFDILRLLVLHKTICDYFCEFEGLALVDKIINDAILADGVPDATQFLASRVICNLFSHESGIKKFLDPSRVDTLIEIIHQGLNSEVKQFKHTAATIIYNVSVNLESGNTDVTSQLVSAVVFILNTPERLTDDITFTLLMALGRLLFDNYDSVELAQTLELNLDPYLSSKVTKVKKAAEEVKLLLDTPL